MTTQQLLDSLHKTYDEGVGIVYNKNRDYAKETDAFKNFRFSELVEVSPARAILVRVSDKLARVSNLLDRPNAVVDEKITDTLIDMINYLAILKAFLEEENGKQK